MLDFQAGEVRKYDVFVFELCQGNISKSKLSRDFTLNQSVEICKQLIEGLQQLEESEKCHNDLKPENILYKISDEKDENGDEKITIKIGDFGTAGRSGGTPGWTWPRFLSKREPGRSDMYSTGLLVLYVMCKSRDLFYRLRDNYIEHGHEWLSEFRKEPIIGFVMKMMKLELTVEEAIQKWNDISGDIDFLQRKFRVSIYNHRVFLNGIGPQWYIAHDFFIHKTIGQQRNFPYNSES